MKYLLISFLIYILFSLQVSCVHEVIIPDDMGVELIDTMDIDTVFLDPCNLDVVYFEKEILPILRSNCALSGCHDSDSAQDGVILESYNSVIETTEVEPYDLVHSEIYTVITDEEEEQRMPPPPNIRLNASQIDLIKRWILQGAENLNCDDSNNPCPAETISYSEHVFPIISMHCLGCHSGGNPSGGLDYTDFSVVNTIALNGRLFGAVNWETGFTKMPFNQDKLDDCSLSVIEAWILAGAPDN